MWRRYARLEDVPGHRFAQRQDRCGVDELLKMNFNFVTMHFFERASIAAMMEHGKENFKNNNTVYSDTYDYGLTREEMRIIPGQEWLDLEEEFNKGSK